MTQADRCRTGRGQTNVDFLVGIVVFLLAVTFVVGAVPQLLVPYDDQETPLVAERTAATVADSLLAVDGTVGVLDVSCTGAFFVGTNDTGCPFDADAPLERRVGVDGSYRVNVTVEWNVTGDPTPETLCYNGGDVGACGSGRLVAGPATPDRLRSVAVARRTVRLDTRSAVVEVRVW